MENNPSKINRILLVVVILLLLIVIWMLWHMRKAEEGKDANPGIQNQLNQIPNETKSQPEPDPKPITQPQPQPKEKPSSEPSWILSPLEFGTRVSYRSDWEISPRYYASPAQQAEGKTYLVGYHFILSPILSSSTGATISWGGPQGGCSVNEFGEFKYGTSNIACVKGFRASIGPSSSEQPNLSSANLKLFGDFVLKNK